MYQHLFVEPQVSRSDRADGSVILTNALAFNARPDTIPYRLREWAASQPDAVFLSEPTGWGRRAVTYSEAWSQVVDLARRFLALGLRPDRALMTLSANSVNHALVILAAMSVGAPVAIMSPTYAAPTSRPWLKLASGLERIAPALILAQSPQVVGEIVESLNLSVEMASLDDLSWIDAVAPAPIEAFEEALAGLDPTHAAKLLFTSGSTGSPKAVINTQRMMVTNMQALAQVWPVLTARPPILVDWLPWSHTFGGNCCFNLALYFGGQLHIDHGKPLPALIGQTAEALSQIAPTAYFNVPAGWEALLPILETDAAFARHFFSRLDFLFNAGAAMPATLRQRLQDAAMAAVGQITPIVGGWGATETAPFSTVLYFPTEHASNLGVPLPGTEIKMVPTSGRYELRVRGPNVTPGYLGQAEATAETFDEEGFFRIGDAGRLADAQRAEAGILFDGRVAENFKLSSGTWVNVGALRLDVIAAGKPLISDVVVAGEGRDQIGLLVFPNEAACRALIGEAGLASLEDRHPAHHPLVARALEDLIGAHNHKQSGSSTRIAAYSVQDTPPDPLRDEITEKGYINQRAVLTNRAQDVARLFERRSAVGRAS